MKFNKYSVGGCLVCLLAGFALLQAVNNSSTASEKKAAPAATDSNSIVGTVVMWWGARNEIPAGWELCDGQKVKTPGSSLTGLKPNLIDRFPKGALSSRNSTDDLRQAVGGSNNMPALQIANIDGLKISEDGEHSHASLDLAGGSKEQIDQADNQDSPEVSIAQTKQSSKKPQSGDKEATITEGRHSHKLNGFVGTDGGINADGDDKTGANQPAYSELFFIIRVK